jgi:hypothetical protein
LGKKHEQELHRLNSYFPRISPAEFKEITVMKHSVLAEVALFIHHPYA